jgi:hypothetical protein
MFLKYISVPFFLISLAIGLFYVYLSTPPPTVIYVYPTPENVNTVLYKDKVNNCYKFNHKEVKCPINPSLIPVQD